MKIAVISAYRHPSRLELRRPSILPSSVPEVIAGLCPPEADIELVVERERVVPFDRGWDLAFVSYLHADFEHAKVLSESLRAVGTTTVAGGRHASAYPEECERYFDSVIVGEPERAVPRLIQDFAARELKRRYQLAPGGADEIRPARYDLIDYGTNRFRLPALEATRGCPFSCGFCVLTGREAHRYRPVADVIHELEEHVAWNRNLLGMVSDAFVFLDNNLGGSLGYLRELCEALAPLRKRWGCAVSFNVLRNEAVVDEMAKAGCRYVYTGLESLNKESLDGMNKRQNRLSEIRGVLDRCHRRGILVSSGMLVGADGDTTEYLTSLPQLLREIGLEAVTFVGIVTPYPGTPWFEKLRSEGRLFEGLSIRDLDGYTLCHRPLRLHPSEVVEHFQSLIRTLSTPRHVAELWWQKLGTSSDLRYRSLVFGAGGSLRGLRSVLANPSRTYLGGLDPLERSDRRAMGRLGIEPQLVTASGDGRAPRRSPHLRAAKVTV